MTASFFVDRIGVEAFSNFFKETYAFNARARVRASHFHKDCREAFGPRFPTVGGKDVSLLLLALVMENPTMRINDGFPTYCGFYRLRKCEDVCWSIQCKCSFQYTGTDTPLVKPSSPSSSVEEEETCTISSEDDESSTDYITYFTD